MAAVFPWYRLGYIIPHRHTDMDGYQIARVAPGRFVFCHPRRADAGGGVRNAGAAQHHLDGLGGCARGYRPAPGVSG
jgi:hypothetical protein